MVRVATKNIIVKSFVQVFVVTNMTLCPSLLGLDPGLGQCTHAVLGVALRPPCPALDPRLGGGTKSSQCPLAVLAVLLLCLPPGVGLQRGQEVGHSPPGAVGLSGVRFSSSIHRTQELGWWPLSTVEHFCVASYMCTTTEITLQAGKKGRAS